MTADTRVTYVHYVPHTSLAVAPSSLQTTTPTRSLSMILNHLNAVGGAVMVAGDVAEAVDVTGREDVELDEATMMTV